MEAGVAWQQTRRGGGVGVHERGGKKRAGAEGAGGGAEGGRPGAFACEQRRPGRGAAVLQASCG